MSFVVTAVTGSVVAGAVTTAAVVGAGASIYGAKKASSALKQGTNASIAEQGRQYDQTREDFSDWRESGQQALGRLNRASTGDSSDFYKSAGYDFVREEGTRNMEKRFSVGGCGCNAMKALNEYNSGLASTEYGNWWNRQSGLANAGQNATQSTAAAGQNSANNISNAYQRQGFGQANIETNQASNINNALQGGISNYLYGRKTGAFGGEESPDGTPPIYDFQGRRIDYGN